MKKRNFVIDRMLYEVISENQLSSFTTIMLRDLYAQRLVTEGASMIPLSKVRLHVYEHLRRMIKAGWAKADIEKKERNQAYHLLELPEHLTLQFVTHNLGGVNVRTPPTCLESSFTGDAARYLSVLHSQLKELELDMLAAMGEVERYKILIKEMPDLTNRLQKPYQSAKEQSSKLVGHFRAVENALVLLQAN
ncbi:MAG: hypothetical protein Q7L19_10720 [Pseudohongiella sp.]|nr:hypothetical protein [Pseudohongiella sp.]